MMIIMRTSILTLASLASLLAFTGCDVDADGALEGDDVAFRCLNGCFQSPHVGLFDISNMNETKNSTATSADNSLTVKWTNIVKNGNTYLELRVTDLAKCEIRLSNTANWEPCEGAYIDLVIQRGSLTSAAKIEIESLSTDSSGPLSVYKYIVKGNLDPVDGSLETHTIHEVCPEGGDGTRAVVMLPNVQAVWADTSVHDGLGELVTSTSNKFSLACDGYAQAKGYTRAKVLPATSARNYGVANYNAITHAMRALLRRPNTTDQYDALTEHGTAIAIRDELHSPAWFDEHDQSPPIFGYGAYLLESVYNGQSGVQSGRKGATCKKSYANFPCSGEGELEFPYGIHRRPEFSPPMLEIDGWDDLPECDTNDLDGFGAISVWEWYEGVCIPQG
jgi:hypothetical protein